MEELTYEEASEKLNEIITKIESGTLSINEALKLIEQGKDLIKICYKNLDKAIGKLTEIKETLDKLEEI